MGRSMRPGKAWTLLLLCGSAFLGGMAAADTTRHALAPGVFAEQLVLQRHGSRSVRLQFTVANDSERPVSLRALGILSAELDMRDVSLIDFEAGVRYGVIADGDGDYLGSHGPDEIAPGGRQSYWAQFAAPPLATRTLTISFRNAMPIDGVLLQPE